MESSLEIVQELHASSDTEGVRALLCERDDLGMQILRTLAALDAERAKSRACLEAIREWQSRTTAPSEAPASDPSPKLQLLRAVLLVRLLTYTASR